MVETKHYNREYYDGPFELGATVLWKSRHLFGEVCWSTKQETCIDIGVENARATREPKMVHTVPTGELEFGKSGKPDELDVEFLLRNLKGATNE